jgi:molecular chaperone DnaK
LGGDDFDNMVLDYICNKFQDEYGVDLRKDPMAHQRLKEAAEKAKIELSSSTQTEINLPYIIPIDGIPKHLVQTITRSEFEKLVDPLISKLKEPCIKAIKDSNFKLEQINEIILVGGSTRIPIIQETVKNIFGKEPSKSVNPDESVSLGAAIQGGVLSGDVKDILLLDVTPISLGIETMGGVFTKLIEGNTTIPTTRSQIFSTAADNQPSVEIHVLQGERQFAKDNKLLGKFFLDGIPPAMRGVPQIEVIFDLDANGILSVTAKDKGTGKTQSIRIEGSSNLKEEEIKRMKDDAEANAEFDRKEKEKVETLNKADSLIFQTEKQIKDFGDKLPESDKSKITDKLEELRTAHKDQNIDIINEKIESLNTVWNDVSTRMYQNQNQEQSNQSNQSSNDDIKDADFEDVK